MFSGLHLTIITLLFALLTVSNTFQYCSYRSTGHESLSVALQFPSIIKKKINVSFSEKLGNFVISVISAS